MIPIARRVWDMKYRLLDAAGTPIDQTIEDTWRRAADALAAIEKDSALWAGRFYDAMTGFRFLPGGRILASAGTGRDATLMNCFVMGTIPDDMSGIFVHLREAALTLQQGGGIGYDFSTLRPKGAPVHGVGADASGPLSFMEVWDAMCRTIMSAGYRRGAMMATLRCDHPDVEAFVDAKREPGRLAMFNLSVLVTDAFIEAVDGDQPWTLSFPGAASRIVSARALWDRIMRAAYDCAEPGVVFIDRINRSNNLRYCETIHATNPCGEQPLPPYGACVLGSIDLARLVRNPFEDGAALDLVEVRELTRTAVRMLDNAIDISRFPLPTQEAEAKAKRRIGLGVTGLADALIQCRARYGSPESMRLAASWMGAIRGAAYRVSAEIAEEKGPFPLFNRDAYLEAETVRTLDVDVRTAIAQHGIRNALLTSVAPTGTISLLAGNISSGVEPVFRFEYARAFLMPNGERRIEAISDYAYRLLQQRHGDRAPLPDYFVDARALTPRDHLVMLSEIQKFVDASISKTINVSPDIEYDAFKAIYTDAYRLGCKGCTAYRPNQIRGAVLEPEVAVETGGGRPGVADRRCPNCLEAGLVRQESCDTCLQCGHSKCL